MERRNLIDRIRFFDFLDEAEKDELADMGQTFIRYKRGETIIAAGSKEDSFYVIVLGRVVVESEGTLIARLAAGSTFGEMTFMNGSPRTSDVVADDDVVVMQLSRDVLDKLTPSCREKVKDQIIEILSARLKTMNEAALQKKNGIVI